MSQYYTIQLRQDTAANWTTVNPVLAAGELGLELDTRKFKVGDGATSWNSLAYWQSGGGGGATDFIDLGDVPVSYAGAGGQYVKVKQTADGLEFEPIEAADLPSGIDAAKIANGTVSNTEFQTLNGAEQPFTNALKTKLDGIESGADVTDATNVNAAGAVMESDYNTAHSVLVQQSGSGSPVAVHLGNNTILGKSGGGDIAALSASTVRSIINVENGADVTDAANVGAVVNAATAKTTPVDADTIPLSDSAASGGLKKLSWANLKATAKAYFDTIYQAALGFTPANKAGDTFTGNISAPNLSGTNTGDQNLFSTIAVSGQSNVVADGTGDTLTLVAGANVTITTDASTDTITISSAGGGGGSVAWGAITGTLSSQTDLQTALDGKVDENSAITGATKTKITYDAKGLVTAGADATTADIADSTDKRYVTEAEKTKLANTSGTNTGDQTITLTGDVTGSGTGSFAATIANDAVTNAKLANMDTARIKGRTTAGTGDPEDLTGTQATTLLDTFTSSLKGLAPASGGGTTNFLRADGTWAAPSGGGGGGADGTVLAPASLSAWADNYNPSGWASTVGVVKLTSSAFVFLSGLTATADGHTVRLVNVGSFPIGLYNQNTDSTAANRFLFDDHDVIVLPGNSVELFYDNTDARWRLAAGYALNENSPFVSRYWNECIATAGDNLGATGSLWSTLGGGSYANDIVGALFNGGRTGVIRCNTGTGATGRAGFYNVFNDTQEYADGTGRTYMEFRAVIFTPSDLSDATNSYFITAGYLDTDSAEPPDGAWLRYNHANSSGNWERVTGNAASRTTANTGIAVAASTWYVLRVVMYPNGTAEFYINGVSGGRNTADLPGTGRDFSFGAIVRKTAGGATRVLAIDGIGFTNVKYTK